MIDHRTQKSRSLQAVMCPDCTAHLEDTWTGEECRRCGFQYLVETDPNGVEKTPSNRTRYRQSIKPGPSLSSTVIAILLGFLGGGGLAESEVQVPEYGLLQLNELVLEIASSGSALFATGLLAAAIITVVASSLNRHPAITSRENP